MRIAAEVGSDLPLFLIGGTVLGIDRGQEVYPLQDLPPMHLVVLTPAIGVSTPQAFADWDALVARAGELTHAGAAGTIKQFGSVVYTWLSKGFLSQAGPASGVPAVGGDRAETPLLDLVRAGIENDFERVVFPEHPELREVETCVGARRRAVCVLVGFRFDAVRLIRVGGRGGGRGGADERRRDAAVATTTLDGRRVLEAIGSCA